MIRAFLAIQPAEDVLQTIEALQVELGDTGADVRWVRREAMHLTIQFLGDVRENEMPAIERGLAEALRGQQPFEIDCRGLGVFPNQKRPRVVWVGLHGEGLGRLAERVETVLSPLGFPPEERELTPHITLGRVRSIRAFENLQRVLKVSADRSLGSSRIDHATLYRSELRPDHAVYTAIAEFPFAG